MMSFPRRTFMLVLGAAAAFVPRLVRASAAEWKSLCRQVGARQEQLLAMIREARRKRLVTDYAEISYQVVALFRQAAEHDYGHMDEVRRIFKGFWPFPKIDPVHTERLPFAELEACLDVADHAMAELKRQLDGEAAPAAPPDFARGRMVLDAFCYRLDDRPVFPYSLVWLPYASAHTQALGNMGGGYWQIDFLEEDGSPDQDRLRRTVESLEQEAAGNAAPMVNLMGHRPARWQKEQHPEILDGARNFTQYDIDSPLVRRWIGQLCEGFGPAMAKACGRQPMVHLLANEPHFATARGGWKAENGISDVTMEKFHAWLRGRYQTLEALNSAYGADHGGWDQVLFHETPPRARQIDPNLRGSPVWYDWCRFNQQRVNEWFAFLKQQVQANDDGRKAPVSIKMLGFTLSRSTRDGGMDIEYLTRLQEVMGADLRVAPAGAQFFGRHEEGMDPETGWQARYAYDWSEQAMFLDFSKSLCPEKVFYDSEWHGFGAVSWRHFNMSREYVRSALWMAFTHGMGAIKPWLWGRGENGALRDSADHIGELSTQPIAVDAYGRTMKELNAHAGRVLAVQPATRDLLVFYCEESAIQDGEYTQGFKSVYEALKLLNRHVGFATPTEIGRLDPAVQQVVVTPTPYIADGSLAALRAFQARGGRIILVGAERSFLKNELGAPRTAGLGEVPLSLPVDTATALADAFETVLASNPFSPLIVAVKDAAGRPARGVMVNHGKDPESGRPVLVLNNFSHERRVVELGMEDGRTPMVADLIRSSKVAARIGMDPCDVRLLMVAE